MKKLSNLKQAGKLRSKTSLKPVTRNITRWSSNYFLLQRYIDSSPYIDRCDTEIVELLPNPSGELKIQDLIVDPTDIQLVTLKLQEESVTKEKFGTFSMLSFSDSIPCASTSVSVLISSKIHNSKQLL